VGIQSDLARRLGGVPRFSDPVKGTQLLRERLLRTRCLLILDDVWDEEHLKSLDVLGIEGCLVVTTRVAWTLTAIGADEFPLPPMDEDAAEQLLAEWAGATRARLPSEAIEVVNLCGRLPLALEVCGKLVRRKAPWSAVLSRMRRAVKRSPQDPHHQIFAALSISAEVLEPNASELYFALGVFPKDTRIPEAAVFTLWDADSEAKKSDAQTLLAHFDSMSLLALLLSGENRYVLFHDLQHDYVLSQCHDMPSLHNRLLDSYGQLCCNHWPDGPVDGYFFEHLVYHLMNARREAEAKRLMLTFAWLRARMSATDVNGLLSDYSAVLATSQDSLQVTAEAIRLSSHVLGDDKDQLAGRWRRIAGHSKCLVLRLD
jgi:hypothetical protein